MFQGRHGRGLIYIWASGNGGHRGDNCECDGYVSSPYTLSISATTTSMRSPYYVESCPSTMAATFSSGGYNEGQIVSISPTRISVLCVVDRDQWEVMN